MSLNRIIMISVFILFYIVFSTISASAQPENPDKGDGRQESDFFAYRMFINGLKLKYNFKESCPDETVNEIKETIQKIWQGYTDALYAGDLEKALDFTSVFRRDKDRKILSYLIDNKKIDAAFGKSRFVIRVLYDGRAECELWQEESKGSFSYPANFIKDPDCVWRINSN